MIKRVFTKRIAEELVKEGFDVIKIEKNFKYPYLNIYSFKVNEKFINRFTELSKR